jgi:hypothetical protein
MAGVTVHMHDAETSADVLVLPDDGVCLPGSRFIVLAAGSDCSIILHGYDRDAADLAREMATALTKAADQIASAVPLVTVTPETATGHSSAQPCGCDPGAKWTCAEHLLQRVESGVKF